MRHWTQAPFVDDPHQRRLTRAGDQLGGEEIQVDNQPGRVAKKLS
jgi:hypothetical protein